MNKCANAFIMCMETIQIQSLSPLIGGGGLIQRQLCSADHLSASELHLRESCFAFLRGRAPRAEFGV